VIYKGRTVGMNPYKERFAANTKLRTLAEAMANADVFLGLSVKGAITPDMVRSMAARPIVFAMANPDPEITYEEAKASRADVIMATGRSDYPNQVNNVLGFPFIFRGALDVRATVINEEMKLAATRALANLAKEDVPDSVCRAYGVARLKFGPDYLIPACWCGNPQPWPRQPWKPESPRNRSILGHIATNSSVILAKPTRSRA
jgi:malate dehydrogenase (oxaloacetate-decarboxylating)(NADP+)